MTNVFNKHIFSKITLFIANIGNFYPDIQKPASPRLGTLGLKYTVLIEELSILNISKN
jgi:hypothetical protein